MGENPQCKDDARVVMNRGDQPEFISTDVKHADIVTAINIRLIGLAERHFYICEFRPGGVARLVIPFDQWIPRGRVLHPELFKRLSLNHPHV